MNIRFDKDINYSINSISNAQQYIEDALYCLNDAESYFACSDSQKRFGYIEVLSDISTSIESISNSLTIFRKWLEDDTRNAQHD
jgi:hypothetical protein